MSTAQPEATAAIVRHALSFDKFAEARFARGEIHPELKKLLDAKKKVVGWSRCAVCDAGVFDIEGEPGHGSVTLCLSCFKKSNPATESPVCAKQV